MADKSAFLRLTLPHRSVTPLATAPPVVPAWSALGSVAFSATLTCGVEVATSSKSFYVFDFSKDPQAASVQGRWPKVPMEQIHGVIGRRLKIMNAFALCLHSAHLSVEGIYEAPFKLTPEHLLHIEPSGGAGSGGTAFLLLALTEAANAGGTPISSVFSGSPIPQEVPAAAVALLDQILEHPEPQAFDLAVLINDALVAASAHDNAGAVVTAWSVCEVILYRMWLALADAVHQQQLGASLSKTKQRDYQHDFTASQVAEFLWLSGKLTKDEHSDLSRVRKARNAWAHSIESPQRDTATLAVRTALHMFEREFGITISANPAGQSSYAP